MKKKFFPIISILVLAILFGVAASCNMCGLNISPASSSTESSIGTNTTAALSQETKTDETAAVDTFAEKTTGDTSAEQASGKTTANSEAAKGTAPTIELKVYEGPTYSQADSVCYSRVEAIVTGDPAPTVEFSKDDSGGAFGSKKVQINLTKNNQSYTLTAKAKNTAGEAVASIDLSWGCGPINNPPTIDLIATASALVTGTAYDITATASDPDGDSLSYEWTVNGGVLKGSEANPVKWTTPDIAGTYNISLTVSDGKGGEVTKVIDVVVKSASISAALSKVESEVGCVRNDNLVFEGWDFGVGDDFQKLSYRGFVSFDISGIPGATIQDAVLTVNKSSGWDTSSLEDFWIGAVDYGSHPLIAQDYNLTGIPLQSFPASASASVTCNSAALKTQLQNAINAGKQRFQIRLHFSVPTDNDNAMDYWVYESQGINLNITYTPK
jgi:hypothetical protein